MALLLVTNPPSTLTVSSQWGDLVERSDKNMLGFGSGFTALTLTNWDSSTLRPQIEEGSIIEVGGSFYQADSDTALVDEGGLIDGIVHIKLIVAGGGASLTPTLTNDVIPAWDANKVGWYTGTTKYLEFEMFLASSKYTEKLEYTNRDLVNKEYIGTSYGRFDVLYSERIISKYLTEFSQVGNTTTRSDDPFVTGLTQSTIAAVTGTTLMTLIWDGSDWSQLGNTLVIALGSDAGISALSSTSVVIAYNTGGNRHIAKYSWDGSDWSLTGNALVIGAGAARDVVALSSSECVVIYGTSLQRFTFDGTDWTSDASATDISPINGNTITALSLNYIVVEDGTVSAKGISTFKWDGSTFNAVGVKTSLPDATDIKSMEAIDTDIVITLDTLNGAGGGVTFNLIVYKWDEVNKVWGEISRNEPIVIGNSPVDIAALTPVRVAGVQRDVSDRYFITTEAVYEAFTPSPVFARGQ
jgi:hypothetical protein